MRHKYVTYSLFAVMFIYVFFPNLARSQYRETSSFAFTMERVVVSGSNLGSYHSLAAGEFVLYGSVWCFTKDADASAQPEPILLEIYQRRDWGVDRRVASLKLTPSTELGEKLYFEQSLGHQPASGYYYFHITKASGQDDGWNIKGAGELRVVGGEN